MTDQNSNSVDSTGIKDQADLEAERNKIHLKMLEKSNTAKNFGELTVIPIGFAVTIAQNFIAEAHKGYGANEQKEREYKEFCRGGRQFLASALEHAALAQELDTGATLESVVRSMIAMFDDMGVPKSGQEKLYTQADVDRAVLEAQIMSLEAVKYASPEEIDARIADKRKALPPHNPTQETK